MTTTYCGERGDVDEIEHFFTCPYCWQQISVLLDTSVRQQHYVEDCEVCCNPIELIFRFSDGALVTFHARPVGG
jgi:transcription elongation factor Elf1